MANKKRSDHHEEIYRGLKGSFGVVMYEKKFPSVSRKHRINAPARKGYMSAFRQLRTLHHPLVTTAVQKKVAQGGVLARFKPPGKSTSYRLRERKQAEKQTIHGELRVLLSSAADWPTTKSRYCASVSQEGTAHNLLEKVLSLNLLRYSVLCPEQNRRIVRIGEILSTACECQVWFNNTFAKPFHNHNPITHRRTDNVTLKNTIDDESILADSSSTALLAEMTCRNDGCVQ
ncbi:uncharacterized protein BT62DRAFT_922795 [Guyanagaster necrorhizus]|uniref:Uncharacterized protein n=1 Tax=Guyanagaster necrorhizus TaxID=856835 RepID=A0A9P8APS6_9AGAR|nr:uncharacterized protein BT62DRAFT_922795 [Guyanagaster necrorhizus MCA 3950]KAG7442162.1 hypothetical protein BT62DRAFT_922795 [Guyanagaster necrorhizus MCA 3950]